MSYHGKPESDRLVAKSVAESCEKSVGYARKVMDYEGNRLPDLTDSVLAQFLKDGYTQAQIARRFGMSQATISRRVAGAYASGEIEFDHVVVSDPAIGTLADPEEAAKATKQMWDSKDGYEQNFARLIAVYHGAVRPADRIRAITEIRKHVEIGHKVAATLYNAYRVNRFIESVTGIFREHDPDSQRRIMQDLVAASGDPASLARVLAGPDQPAEASAVNNE